MVLMDGGNPIRAATQWSAITVASTVVVKAVSTGTDAVPLGPPLLLAFCYGSLPLVVLGRETRFAALAQSSDVT